MQSRRKSNYIVPTSSDKHLISFSPPPTKKKKKKEEEEEEER